MAVNNKILKKTFSKGNIANGLFTTWAAVDTFSDSRQQGNGVMYSALAAAGDAALSFVMKPIPYLMMAAVPMLGEAAVATVEGVNAYSRNLQRLNKNKPFQSTPTFVDTQQAYTMRQAGMQLAQNSKYYTTQALLGNEAQMISR